MKKKFLMPVLFVFITIRAFSQSQFGIVAGPQFATRNYPEELNVNVGFITTINAGATAFFTLTKELLLHETIGYSGKGVTLKNIQLTDDLGNSLGNGRLNILVNYIELRSPLVYKTDLAPEVDLMIGGGPYFSYAFGGHHQAKGEHLNAAQRKKYKIDFESQQYNRFDLGINAEVGIQIKKKILMSLCGDFGFVEVVNSADHNTRNTSLSFTVGYLINKQKKKQKE